MLAFAAFGAIDPVAQTQAPPATEIYLAPFTAGEAKTTQIGIITIERSGVSVGKAVNITNNPGYDNQPQFLPDSSAVLFSSEPRRQAERHLPLRHHVEECAPRSPARPRTSLSPTMTPDGKTFTTVRGGSSGCGVSTWTDGCRPGVCPRRADRLSRVGVARTTIAAFILGTQPRAPTRCS